MPSMFWFRPIFMLALLVGESIFLIKLNRRKGFWWRALVSVLACFLMSFLIPYQIDNGLYGAFMFIVLFFLTVVTYDEMPEWQYYLEFFTPIVITVTWISIAFFVGMEVWDLVDKYRKKSKREDER